MEENQFESASQFTTAPKKKINKRFLYLVIAIVFIVLAVLGYTLIGSSNKSNTLPQADFNPTPTLGEAPTDSPTPTIEEVLTTTPTEEPTNTPTPKVTTVPLDKSSGLDRSNLTITVENGSGEVGVAGSGKSFLEGLGYVVSGTANADNYDYVNVTIKIKKASEEYLSLLKKDLNTKYTVGDTATDLESSNSSDAVVIIGK
jgi:flagellar basal body-associated protein FliL